MKKTILFALFCLCKLLSAQELFPYLQAPSSTYMNVNWKTESNEESIVEYGNAANSLNQTVNGTTQIFSDTGYPANYYYHSVKIENLQPNTKYFYRIKTGNRVSNVYCFRTLPLAGQASTADGHLRFLIMGDNQMKGLPRYDSLVSAAKRKIAEKWGYDKDPSDNVIMTIMTGDQVDVGTLDHYENVHFLKNRKLSGYLPIQTLVGNHETYGTLNMQAYYDHYILDDLSYQGISSGSEAYYARQIGNVLFLCFDTEHPSNAQIAWLNQILPLANQDSTVDWIVSLGHRPYQAEQYVGDISTWIRNTVMPILNTSSKHILHIGAHHHLYHRGQLKNYPTYQIISGGVAWDQYWGMSTEQDFEDVQKTLPNWMYQIIDVDLNNQSFNVESYSIGSVFNWKNNVLMDEFHHYKNKQKPNTPSIVNNFTGQDLELPITIESSAYSSSSDELLNTTEFLISKTSDFSIVDKDIYRDFEDFYGPVGSQTDESTNINQGVDITKATLNVNSLTNGTYYTKVRHRDQNLKWSDWSSVKSFNIINSIAEISNIELDTIAYHQNSKIKVSFTGATGNSDDWIGLYYATQTPGSSSPSQKWNYLNQQTSGTLEFATGLPNKGQYYAAMFINDGYEEIADRKYFYVGPFASVTTNQELYSTGSPVTVNFANAPALTNDWIGIYKVGQTPGSDLSSKFQYVNGQNQGAFTFNNLADGYYFVQYFLEDGYNTVGNKAFFQVGQNITELEINKSIYNLNENIMATWTDGPGIVKDWLGIFHEGDDPNIDPLVSYTYFNGNPNESIEIPDENLPTETGNYFIVMFTNDSYNEVSNRVEFQVIDETMNTDNPNSLNSHIQVYPNPVEKGKNTFIKSKYPIDQIDVLDMTGSLFYTSKNIKSYNYSLLNQNLPAGVYYLKIHADKIYTVKIIVK